MKVNRVVGQLSSLSQLLEFDALDLNLLESLPKDRMPAEKVVRMFGIAHLVKRVGGGVAGGDNLNAAGQQPHRRPRLGAALADFQARGQPAKRERFAIVGPSDALGLAGLRYREVAGGGEVDGVAAGRLIDFQFLGMVGQIIGARNDYVVTHLPIQWKRTVHLKGLAAI